MTNRDSDKTVHNIRRATRRQFLPEEKIRIVLVGLRGEETISKLCQKEGIALHLCFRSSKEFLGTAKKRHAGRTALEATPDEVKDLSAYARRLKVAQAEATLEGRLMKANRDRAWARRRMRYPASEKLEIIRFVENSPLRVRRTLTELEVPKSPFYA